MPLSLEPQILQEWLAPFNLTLENLTLLPHSLQAELLGFLLPNEETELDERTQVGLNLLGWAVGTKALQEEPSKKLLRVLLRLFLTVDELGPAAYIFFNLWPDPEPARVTYFSELVQLNLAQHKLEAALQALAEMQELYAGRYTTFITEAEICLYQGEFEAARTAYLKGLETSPLSHRLILNLAAVACKQDQFEETAARLDQMEQLLEPGKVSPIKAARLWQKLGNADRAAQITEAYNLHKQQRQVQLCQEIQELTLAEQAESYPLASDQTGLAGQNPDLQPRPDNEALALSLIPELARPGESLPEAVFQVLRDIFGHEEFRPGQEQVIANILAGHDTLAVLPTGAGKSLCYQLPALLLPRPVLVLSPLISLMKDQFDKLPPALKKHTLIINSSLEPAEAVRRLRELARPDSSIRLVYAAPERLRQATFVKALTRGGLGLIVVDEAHCVTMWGNDFRPDYLFIRRALTGLDTPLLAVTATATPQVAGEITRELGRDFKLVRGSVFRSNLSFSVEKVSATMEPRLEKVAEIAKTLPGSGIIYARSREKCEQVAAALRQQGVKARHYHAGMDNDTRQQAQESWTSGQTRVIVATIAFGMGIDKPDVRYIIHFNPATSLENYMQEAGRAGRDGLPAHCILLYSSSDKGNLTRWLREEREQLDLETLRAVYKIIARRLGRERRGIISLDEILAGSYATFPPPDETVVRVALSLLERAGLLERGFDLPLSAQLSLPLLAPASPFPPEVIELSRLVGLDSDRPVQLDLVSVAGQLNFNPIELDDRLLDWHEAGFVNYQPGRRQIYLELKDAGNEARSRLEELLTRRQAEAEHRLDQLESYFKAPVCRQMLLARHFGEKLSQRCGTCDNCTSSKTVNLSDRLSLGPAMKQPVRAINQPPKMADDESTGLILGSLNYITGGEGQLGRSGLVNLLMGRKTALGTRANNPFKGKFETLRVKDVEALVESLVVAGLIEEHPAQMTSGRTYRAIRVSEKGQLCLEANPPDLP